MKRLNQAKPIKSPVQREKRERAVESNIVVGVNLPQGLLDEFNRYLSENGISDRKRSRSISEGLNRFLGRRYWMSLILERSIDLTGSNPKLRVSITREDAAKINTAIESWNERRAQDTELQPWERIIELKQADFIRMAIMTLCYPDLTALDF